MAMKQLVAGILTSLVIIGTAQAQSVDDYYAELKEWVYGPCMEVAAALRIGKLSKGSREQGAGREGVALYMLTTDDQDIREAAKTLASGIGRPDWDVRKNIYPSLMRLCIKQQLSDYVAVPAKDTDYTWPVVSVVDGDTVKVDAIWDMPPGLASLAVRLRGVDTPEKGDRAKCSEEREAGERATAFTTDAIAAAKEIVVRDPEWGKWGGRVIADLLLDRRNLSEMLVDAGHGRRYDGGRRRSWCGG